LKIETDPAKSATSLVGKPATSTSGSTLDFYGLFTKRERANVKASVGYNFRMGDGTSVVSVGIQASNPLIKGAPSAEGNFTFNISSDGSRISLNGSNTVYPAWEINVQDDSTGAQGNLLQYTPVGTFADSPGALLTGAVRDADGRTTLPDKPPGQCSTLNGAASCPN
jgi:hypothetical protein